MLVDLPVQPGKVTLLLIGGTDLPYIFQRLLHPVRDPHSGALGPLRLALSELPAPKQQAEGHRHPPEAGKGQPPVIPEQAHRNHGGREVGAVQIAQHMAPDVLHAVDIAHQGLRQVGQIPLAEKAERQLAKPLRQTQAGGLDLTVHQAVGGLVLLEMREKGEKCKYHEASQHRQSRRQDTAGQSFHQAGHHKVQNADPAHDYQIDDYRPEGSLFGVLYTLIRQGIFPLKVCSEHYRSSFPLSIFHWIARL